MIRVLPIPLTLWMRSMPFLLPQRSEQLRDEDDELKDDADLDRERMEASPVLPLLQMLPTGLMQGQGGPMPVEGDATVGCSSFSWLLLALDARTVVPADGGHPRRCCCCRRPNDKDRNNNTPRWE